MDPAVVSAMAKSAQCYDIIKPFIVFMMLVATAMVCLKLFKCLFLTSPAPETPVYPPLSVVSSIYRDIYLEEEVDDDDYDLEYPLPRYEGMTESPPTYEEAMDQIVDANDEDSPPRYEDVVSRPPRTFRIEVDGQ